MFIYFENMQKRATSQQKHVFIGERLKYHPTEAQFSMKNEIVVVSLKRKKILNLLRCSVKYQILYSLDTIVNASDFLHSNG